MSLNIIDRKNNLRMFTLIFSRYAENQFTSQTWFLKKVGKVCIKSYSLHLCLCCFIKD